MVKGVGTKEGKQKEMDRYGKLETTLFKVDGDYKYISYKEKGNLLTRA